MYLEECKGQRVGRGNDYVNSQENSLYFMSNVDLLPCIFRLWFDEMIGIWDSVQNAPQWEAVSTAIYSCAINIHFMGSYFQLVYLSTTSCIPFIQMFSRLMLLILNICRKN